MQSAQLLVVTALGKRNSKKNSKYVDELPKLDPPEQSPPQKRTRSNKVAPKVTSPPVVAHPPVSPTDLTDPLSGLEEIIQGYSQDPWFSESCNTNPLRQMGGVWYQGDQIVVPDIPWLKKQLLFELHDAPYSGHCGVTKTLEAVSRLFWWPRLRPDVESYIAGCEACQTKQSPLEEASWSPATTFHPERALG
jgi:hypothetical protein